MLVGDELEVDSVHNGPDLPRTLASRQEVVLELVANHGKTVTVDETQVGEENSHEAGAPEKLINGNLEGNVLGFLAGNLAVKPVVEIVTRGTVVDETKDGESDETLHVEWATTDEKLKQ